MLLKYKMVCKTDLKGEVPEDRSTEDAPRQLAEFGVAPFQVMNVSTSYNDQVHKHKTPVVILGGGETGRLLRKQPAPDCFQLCDN